MRRSRSDSALVPKRRTPLVPKRRLGTHLSPKLCFVLTLLLVPTANAADPNPATLHAEGGAWPLYRQWNTAEIHHYAAWIEKLYDIKWRGTYEQRLAKLEGVLTDPAMNRLLDPAFAGSPVNPPLDRETIREVHQVLDCGNLTVVLPAYYACRRGLPWMGTTVRSTDGIDLRKSDRNTVVSEFSCRDFDSPAAFVREAVATLCTGNFRINPAWPGAERSDTVAAAIEPDVLLPGALYYLDGHVAILAKITPTGNLRFLDATLAPTRDIYTHNAYNMVSGLTPRQPGDTACFGCFRGFRIYRYPIAETDASGKVLRVRRRSDAEMRSFGYSLDQYDRLAEQHRAGTIQTARGPVRGLHDFIRARLRTVDAIDPRAVLSSYALTLAAQLKRREDLVQAAWRDLKAKGPIPFPDANADATIYNARGRWGQFSSLSLDMEIREDYFILVDELAYAIKTYAREPAYVHLPNDAADLVQDDASLARWVMGEKQKIFNALHVEITNSKGEKQSRSLLQIEQRLFDLSFDPNHPPELRWGDRPMNAQPPAFTQLATGGRLPALTAYQLQGIYRTRSYRDTNPTPLRGMPTQGYPKRDLLDAYLTARWALDDPAQRHRPSTR